MKPESKFEVLKLSGDLARLSYNGEVVIEAKSVEGFDGFEALKKFVTVCEEGCEEEEYVTKCQNCGSEMDLDDDNLYIVYGQELDYLYDHRLIKAHLLSFICPNCEDESGEPLCFDGLGNPI